MAIRISSFGTERQINKEMLGFLRHLYVRGAHIQSAHISGQGLHGHSLVGWEDAKAAL